MHKPPSKSSRLNPLSSRALLRLVNTAAPARRVRSAARVRACVRRGGVLFPASLSPSPPGTPAVPSSSPPLFQSLESPANDDLACLLPSFFRRPDTSAFAPLHYTHSHTQRADTQHLHTANTHAHTTHRTYTSSLSWWASPMPRPYAPLLPALYLPVLCAADALLYVLARQNAAARRALPGWSPDDALPLPKTPRRRQPGDEARARAAASWPPTFPASQAAATRSRRRSLPHLLPPALFL